MTKVRITVSAARFGNDQHYMTISGGVPPGPMIHTHLNYPGDSNLHDRLKLNLLHLETLGFEPEVIAGTETALTASLLDRLQHEGYKVERIPYKPAAKAA